MVTANAYATNTGTTTIVPSSCSSRRTHHTAGTCAALQCENIAEGFDNYEMAFLQRIQGGGRSRKRGEFHTCNHSSSRGLGENVDSIGAIECHGGRGEGSTAGVRICCWRASLPRASVSLLQRSWFTFSTCCFYDILQWHGLHDSPHLHRVVARKSHVVVLEAFALAAERRRRCTTPV